MTTLAQTQKLGSEPRYDEETLQKGLAALVLEAGNASRASRRLEAQGVEISRQALSTWPHRYAERYAKVRDEILPQVAKRTAALFEDNAIELTLLAQELIEKTRQEIPNMKASDVAGALRNVETSKGINATQASIYRERPQVIVEHRTADHYWAELRRMGMVVDATTAEDEAIEDAEEVPALPASEREQASQRPRAPTSQQLED